MNQPNLQLTPAELDRTRQILENYEPAREALTVLERNNGEFATSFDRLWTERNETLSYGDKQKSFWEVTLKVLRQEICGDEGFRSKILDYNKNPGSASLLTGAIIYLVGVSAVPIDPAIATIIVLYILKVGLNIFCEYTNPESD
ncbi:hypothetical protein V0288_23365 [Pannus brasiliensis CCIBt3594]|uniref:Uncharacterized protein n=1 Tax=Pannus brasiliensis CCIBt3594 TaxID=1427578 RepID=A0AAW9R0P1_9CHRO